MQPTPLIAKAALLAAHHHQGQKYGDRDYTYHLSQVASVLIEFGFTDEELIAAAWLHDAFEDTDATYFDLTENGIPIYTVALVDAVTNREGKNRAERHALTYPRIARMSDAVTLKLADRIANVRACIELKDARLEMYRKEELSFREALDLKFETRHGGMFAELGRLLDEDQ